MRKLEVRMFWFDDRKGEWNVGNERDWRVLVSDSRVVGSLISDGGQRIGGV